LNFQFTVRAHCYQNNEQRLHTWNIWRFEGKCRHNERPNPPRTPTLPSKCHSPANRPGCYITKLTASGLNISNRQMPTTNTMTLSNTEGDTGTYNAHMEPMRD